jgi:hypothetical protein
MARRVWRSLGRLVYDIYGISNEELLTGCVLEHESGPCVLCEVELGAEVGWVECFGDQPHAWWIYLATFYERW